MSVRAREIKGDAMGLSADSLRTALNALAGREPRIAVRLEAIGYPEPRIRAPGYETLLRTIVGQQVSVAAATAIWRKLEATLSDMADPVRLLAASDEALRGGGLSRQKIGYARSLAALVADGTLDLANLPEEDEAAIAELVRIKGIGRWSAEIYLLFAEGRGDIWPAGDLAVQVEVGRLLGLADRPREAETRAAAETWRPYRGAAAIFAWHSYGMTARIDKPAPV